MGFGIWSMHYIACWPSAFRFPCNTTGRPSSLSLVAAIAASAIALVGGQQTQDGCETGVAG